MQIKNLVLPRMTNYKNDLLKIDKSELRGYQGELIHCSRDTGTDSAIVNKIKDLNSLEYAFIFCMREQNDLFLICINNQVKKVSRECALNWFIALAKQVAAINDDYLNLQKYLQVVKY